MDTVATICGLLTDAGRERYGMEAVSQLDHALQCALLAEQGGHAPALVAAALLHDIGHLVGAGDEGLAEKGVDARHEKIAAVWLGRHFGPAVCEPVRLHVDAKRYLCRTEPAYWSSLSEASRASLKVQGGPFDAAAASLFIAQPFAGDAVQLRRWDDLAKVPQLRTPDIDHYRPLLADLLHT
jgi:phosphonate degradation associated HDIG domain protein